MAGEFTKLSVSVKGQVNAIAVDCPKYSDLCQKQHIKAYPTLRLYRGGNMTAHQGERSKQAMLAFLQKQGAYSSLHSIRTQDLDSELRQTRVKFLYIAAPSATESEKNAVDLAGIDYDHGKILYATDLELLRRFPHTSHDTGYASVGSRLLVFKEYQTQPSAALELPTLSSKESNIRKEAFEWFQRHGYERLAQVDSDTLHDTLENMHGQSVVLAVLGADTNDASALSAQVDSVHQLANAWSQREASSANAAVRFVWLDGERYPHLLKRFNVHVAQVPKLLYFRPTDHTVVAYDGSTWLDQNAAFSWLENAHAGGLPGSRYGSMLDRTMTSMRHSGSEAQSLVQTHPLLTILLVVGLLFVIPRVRSAIRPMTHGYRKLV